MSFITTLQTPLVCRLQPPPIANSYDCNQPLVGSNIGGSAYRSRSDSSTEVRGQSQSWSSICIVRYHHCDFKKYISICVLQFKAQFSCTVAFLGLWLDPPSAALS